MDNVPAYACAGDEVDLWPEIPVCGYSQQTAVGRDRAEEVLEMMRRRDAPSLLGHVFEAMIRSGKFDGAAVGFCHVISVKVMQPPVVEFVEVQSEPRFPISAKRGCLRMVAAGSS